MKRGLLLIIVLGMSVGVSGAADLVWPGKQWEHRKPAEMGLDAAKLKQMSDFAGGFGCVVRGGYMVYTWGDAGKRMDVASAVKPLYTHFLLKAIEDGKIASLDEKVVKWEPRLANLNKDLGYKDREITWRHLCNQISCYGVREKPGEAFDYSDWNMALLFDTLFLKVYGTTWDKVDDQVLRPMLTDPIGCQDNPTFMAFGTGNRPGRLAISPRDFARFGLLYLRGGKWRDKQIISRKLAMFAPRKPVPISVPRTKGEKAEMIAGQRSIGGGNNQCDHNGNYSNAWWINGVGRDGTRNWPDVEKDAFGCFGHGDIRAVVVMPELDIIVSWNATRLEGHEKVNHALGLVVAAAKDGPPAAKKQEQAKAKVEAIKGEAKDLGQRQAMMWDTQEWEVKGVASGDPFDVAGVATFVHAGDGRTRRTEVFYKGDGKWAFRFAPTLAGRWELRVDSPCEWLDGCSGTVVVRPNGNSKLKGFVTNVGNKFAIMGADEDDLKGYVFTVYMGRHKISAMLEDWPRDPEKVAAQAKAYLADALSNGFEIVFLHVNNNWFKLGDAAYTGHKSEDPDPAAFDVIETIIRTVHSLGGRVHIWAWGDESRKWTPRGVKGGINGPADRRLQRYIAARLGPLPGWTMGYGFDLHEWTTSEQLNSWASYMHERMGWQHLLCARGQKLAGLFNMDSYDGFGRNVPIATTEHGPRDFAEIAEDMQDDRSRPHFYEERHSYMRTGFNLDMDGTRRLLWRETMAGGMGGFFGFYPTSPHPYPNPEQLVTHRRFWHEGGRFRLAMELERSGDGTLSLQDARGGDCVYYGEDVSQLRIHTASGGLKAVAVDLKKQYKEIPAGTMKAGDNTWEAPYKSDWAVAVGDFSGGQGSAARGLVADGPWMRRRDDSAMFMCGPGDPEGFLYRGKQRPDGTRDGDQMELIKKMTGTGANCIYMISVRSHGGDGDRTQNPFMGNDPARGLNPKVLDQWAGWFKAMDKAGIVIYLFVYDDSALVWRTGDRVGDQERAFLRGLVKRFEGFGNLVWCVAEEYHERLSTKRASAIAGVIRSADSYSHPVAVHLNNGLDFSAFADDKNLDQFAIQYNVATADELHAGMIKAFADARGRYSLNMSECADMGTGRELRVKNWACAMGGAYVMILGMDIAGTPREDLLDCGFLVKFMEQTKFDRMAPHDELVGGDTKWVLAGDGGYIAYSPDCGGRLDINGVEAGDYTVLWGDCQGRRLIDGGHIRTSGGDLSLEAPKGFGKEVAVCLQRIGL